MSDHTVPPHASFVQPIPFLFEGDTLIRIVDQDGDPWFLVTDLLAIMKIKNATWAIKNLREDEKAVVTITNTNSDGGNDRRIIVSESGMYTIILRSHAAIDPSTQAYRFRRWITAEVIPAIRKTGRYEMPNQQKIEDMPIGMKIRMINTAYRLSGPIAGIQAWRRLGLIDIPAFEHTLAQHKAQYRFDFMVDQDLDDTPPDDATSVN